MTRRRTPPALPLPLAASLLLLLPSLLPTAPAAPAPIAASGLTRACGSQLADLLAAVCRGRGYNDPLSSVAAAAWTPTAAAAATAGTASPGVADLCCRRGCSFRTLQQYCSPADPRRSSGLGASAAAPAANAVAPAAAPTSAAASSSSHAAAASAAAAAATEDESSLSPPVRALLEKRLGGSSSNGAAGSASPSSPAPPTSLASFRVGVVRSYFDDFVLPPGAAAAAPVSDPAAALGPAPAAD